MALRLSTGFRNLQLGMVTNSFTNAVLLGEDTSASDVSASWTEATTNVTGNNTVSGRTGVLSLSSANGTITQECTVIPGHTYRLSYDCYSDGTTGTIKADIGTTTLDDDIYSGIAFTAPATWTTYGDGTDVSLYRDDTTTGVNDGAIVFTAGASTTSVHLTFTRTTTDVISLDNVRLIDQARSLGEIFRGGELKIYSGSQPTAPDNAATGTLLVTIKNGGSTGFTWDDASAGSISKAAAETWNGVCGADGTAGWARIVTPNDPATLSTAYPRIDMSVGTSGAQLNFTTTYFQNGSTQTITSLAISIPQG